MIWEARPQICRLHNCHVPRIEVLRLNPSIVVDDDMPLIDLHDAFILGDSSDPRFRPPTGHRALPGTLIDAQPPLCVCSLCASTATRFARVVPWTAMNPEGSKALVGVFGPFHVRKVSYG